MQQHVILKIFLNSKIVTHPRSTVGMGPSDIDGTVNLQAHTLNKVELEIIVVRVVCSKRCVCSKQGTCHWCDWFEYENKWPANGIMYKTKGFHRGG